MSKIMIRPIAFLLLSSVIVPSVVGDCQCTRANKLDTTRWGGNEMLLFIEEKSYRSLQGTIETSDGRVLENVLVEVFDHPDALLDKLPHDSPQQKRLAVCRTAEEGKFCFRNLPSGKYELRASLSSGWNVTHVYVVVEKKRGTREGLHVKMSVGT